MDQIVNKHLFAADKFMPEMHSRKFGFAYSAYGPLAQKKDEILKKHEI